jgi:hypothetical protein
MPEQPTVTDSGSPQPQGADSGTTQSIGETVIQVGGITDPAQATRSESDGQIKVLEQRIGATEAKLKEKQAELTDVASRAALARDLAETKGQLQTLVAALNEPDSKEKESEKDWLETTDWDEALTQKPGETVRDMARRLRGDVAKLLDERDKTLSERYESRLAAAMDPERQQLTGVLNALAGDVPGWKDLAPMVQIGMAKAAAKLAGGNISAPAGEPTPTAPAAPLSPAGTGVSPTVIQDVSAERKAKARELARRMGFSDLNPKSVLKPVMRFN